MPQSGSVKENLQQSSSGLFSRKWLSPKGILVLLTVARILQPYHTAPMLPIALPGTKPGVVLTPIPSWCKALTAAACHPYHG
jgi:hypothetical protein